LCPDCGKRCYASRKQARAAERDLRGRGHYLDRLSPYRCGDWWHLGHLPRSVRDGIRSRDDLRGAS
jgi:hypothetical protein